MKITYLGQAGLLVEAASKAIIIDPYLSNSVEAIEPQNYRRKPIDERFLEIKPDVVICTHDHLDHTDPDTLAHYLGDGSHALVLAPFGAWKHIRSFAAPTNNCVMFNTGTAWSEGEIRFSAVKAEHSDREAIGVVIECEGKTLYVTGDTLYNEEVLASAPRAPYALFLPINGRGNNMNIADAERFAREIGARYTVPFHVGLFDEIDPSGFVCEGRVIPEIYREIIFE